MRRQPNGFIIPEPLDGTDGSEYGLKNYCPGISVEQKRPLRNSPERFYGPFQELQVAYARVPEIRHKGASGGLLTALLCGLLEEGEVDGVLQVGVSPDNTTWSSSQLSTTVDQVIANAGTRYAPASLLEHLKQVLDEHSKIAIVGKPCDIVAVRQFLKIYPQYESKISCTMSFMCMGLPSQNATQKLIKRLGFDDDKEVSSLTYRGDGWPGRARVVTSNGSDSSCSYSDSWGDILGRDVLFRCKICPDGWGSFADISAGDAWYTDGQAPLFEDKPGRSILFTRTDRGRKVMQVCANKIVSEPYDIGELPIIQKSQHERKNRVWIAYLLLKLRGDRLLSFKGLGMWRRMFSLSPRNLYRETRGILRRIQDRSRDSR
jgi:coenzyme F420 hydrogenase subunit beta